MGSCLSHSQSFKGHKKHSINIHDKENVEINLKTNQDKNNIIDPYHRIDLLTNSFSELKKFTFDKILTQAKVIDVYDGDTVTIVFYYNQNPIKNTFRLYGYDTPEKKPSKNAQNREVEMKAANVVKKKLKELILNQVVWVKFMKEEKYGRLMGDIYIIEKGHENQFGGNEQHINQWMIDKGYGNPYKGGSKQEFTLEQLNKICES